MQSDLFLKDVDFTTMTYGAYTVSPMMIYSFYLVEFTYVLQTWGIYNIDNNGQHSRQNLAMQISCISIYIAQNCRINPSKLVFVPKRHGINITQNAEWSLFRCCINVAQSAE